MKSETRTVLAATLDGVSSYSSGSLDVGDLEILLVSVNSTSGSGTFAVNVVDANGNVYQTAQVQCTSGSPGVVVIGGGSTFLRPPASGFNYGIPYFGDQIQIDLISGTPSAQLSVKGK
jgi:hypothetical protein